MSISVPRNSLAELLLHGHLLVGLPDFESIPRVELWYRHFADQEWRAIGITEEEILDLGSINSFDELDEKAAKFFTGEAPLDLTLDPPTDTVGRDVTP